MVVSVTDPVSVLNPGVWGAIQNFKWGVPLTSKRAAGELSGIADQRLQLLVQLPTSIDKLLQLHETVVCRPKPLILGSP